MRQAPSGADQPDIEAANVLFNELRVQFGDPVPTSAWVVIFLTLAGLLYLALRSLVRRWRRTAIRADYL